MDKFILELSISMACNVSANNTMYWTTRQQWKDSIKLEIAWSMASSNLCSS